jgi:transposase InsO family protein
MARLTYKKRVIVVREFLKWRDYKKIALIQNIHWRTVFKLVKKYNDFGWEGLRDHRPGRPIESLNPKAVDMIVNERRKTGYGANKLELLLKKRGFDISHRKIHRVLLNEGLANPCPNKQKPRKYSRYEMPNSNDLWHTDWTGCPFTGHKLTVYIDDSSRYIVGYGLYVNSFSEYGIALLKSTIAEYGKPKAIMTDHGSQYYSMVGGLSAFQKFLFNNSIKHQLAPVGKPRVNGKVERWFQTYKQEFNFENYTSLKDFIDWYNNQRMHCSLGYLTPREIFEDRLP